MERTAAQIAETKSVIDAQAQKIGETIKTERDRFVNEYVVKEVASNLEQEMPKKN